ncbi:uncharacterized protein LOC112650182 [Canis lupus dingo]|uniref:uncharacterized protein LOC112650182 n=1 Tax=Canis lupus dingo TaxID=286419 RepID=UPI0015F1584D|nr:uncharacterized protein LOC112650182 [Canis lupus dingo]
MDTGQAFQCTEKTDPEKSPKSQSQVTDGNGLNRNLPTGHTTAASLGPGILFVSEGAISRATPPRFPASPARTWGSPRAARPLAFPTARPLRARGAFPRSRGAERTTGPSGSHTGSRGAAGARPAGGKEVRPGVFDLRLRERASSVRGAAGTAPRRASGRCGARCRQVSAVLSLVREAAGLPGSPGIGVVIQLCAVSELTETWYTHQAGGTKLMTALSQKCLLCYFRAGVEDLLITSDLSGLQQIRFNCDWHVNYLMFGHG